MNKSFGILHNMRENEIISQNILKISNEAPSKQGLANSLLRFINKNLKEHC